MNAIEDGEALARAAEHGVGDDFDLWPQVRARAEAGRRGSPTGRRLAYGAAALTVIAALTLGLVALLGLPAEPVSAEAMVGKAQAAMTAPGVVRTYHLRQVLSYPAKAGYQVTREVWYDGQDRQRTRIETPAGAGVFDVEEYVSNGAEGWIAVTQPGLMSVVHTTVPKVAQQAEALGQENTLAGLLAAYGTERWCMTATADGEGSVAGQATYIIALTPRTDGCGVAPGGKTEDKPARQNAPTRLWVDKRTFLPLKMDMIGPDGTVMKRMEATEVQYDVALDPALFAYTPPAGAIVKEFDGSPGENLKTLLNGVEAPVKKP